MSWKEPAFVAKQMPVYDDEEELSNAVSHLESCSPLVFAGEVRTLHEQLARACHGQGFLLMGGDCAEAFDEFNVDHIRDTFRFKCVVFSFRDAVDFVLAMHNDRSLCPNGGLSPQNVAKLDVAKLKAPKGWGWR